LEQKKRDAWIEKRRKANIRALFDRMSTIALIGKLIARLDGSYCSERSGYPGGSEVSAG
jgi:hypothetical protein